MNSKVQLFFGFLLLAVIVALAVFGVVATGRWLLALDPQFSGPIIAGIIGLASLIYAQWHSKGREIQQSHRPQKIEVYNEFFERTFEIAGGGTMKGIETVVVSRTLRPRDHPNVTILSEGIEEAVSLLRTEPGKDIWLFGGGVLFRSLLDAGLVDTVEVGIIPVLLGGGTPLLPPGGRRVLLRLTGSKLYEKTGTVSLEYTVEAA